MGIPDVRARVPDYSSAVFSSQEMAQLQQAAEQTIAAVELQIETGDDHGAVQLELARAVYALRLELEDIDRWRRHYLGHADS